MSCILTVGEPKCVDFAVGKAEVLTEDLRPVVVVPNPLTTDTAPTTRLRCARPFNVRVPDLHASYQFDDHYAKTRKQEEIEVQTEKLSTHVAGATVATGVVDARQSHPSRRAPVITTDVSEATWGVTNKRSCLRSYDPTQVSVTVKSKTSAPW